MVEENKKPYILYVAEAIYLEIFKIKKQNNDISNIDAIERFMGSKSVSYTHLTLPTTPYV